MIIHFFCLLERSGEADATAGNPQNLSEMLPCGFARGIIYDYGITTQDHGIRRFSDPDGIGIIAHHSPALLGLAKHHDPRLIRRVGEPSRFCKDPQESRLASRLPDPGAPDRA